MSKMILFLSYLILQDLNGLAVIMSNCQSKFWSSNPCQTGVFYASRFTGATFVRNDVTLPGLLFSVSGQVFPSLMGYSYLLYNYFNEESTDLMLFCSEPPSKLIITSSSESSHVYAYEVTWKKPVTGGRPIREYEFRFRQVWHLITQVVSMNGLGEMFVHM